MFVNIEAQFHFSHAVFRFAFYQISFPINSQTIAAGTCQWHIAILIHISDTSNSGPIPEVAIDVSNGKRLVPQTTPQLTACLTNK
jgi:hypothetical protein